MIRTFLYYIVLTFKNRVIHAARRLRRPKYLISALAGLAYLYLVFFRQAFAPRHTSTLAPVIPGMDTLLLMQTGFACALFVMALLPWIWPGRGENVLRFTEAEIQFLFPAPISRRTLLHFRLIKMQIGIIFGVLVSYFFLGRGRFTEHPSYALAALWVVYSFLALYYVGTNLTQTSLAEHGVSGIRRQGWAIGVLATVILAIAAWLKWFIAPFPQGDAARLSDFSDWFLRVTQAGPAYYLLYPFQALVRPAFATDPAAFLLRLVPALAVVFLAYLWVMRNDVSFEEASLDRARKFASRLEAARGGGYSAMKGTGARRRRPIFRLAPGGFAHMPIFWKNLISIRRLGMMRTLPAFVSIGIAMAVILATRRGEHQVVPAIIGSLCGVMAGFLTLLGPMLVRDDLRTDLVQIDMLKTYPIPGWSVVLGEVLAPASVLAVGEWILLSIAAITLPGVGKFHPSAWQRIIVVVSAALLLPCFSLLGVLIQNAATLIWPGWVELGKTRRPGVEAMGQRLISMVGTVLVLIFAVVPAGLVFALVFFSGLWLIGMSILPVAALVSVLALLAEAGLAIFWLGRLYDKFDVSLES